jgi:hypothetical protein
MRDPFFALSARKIITRKEIQGIEINNYQLQIAHGMAIPKTLAFQEDLLCPLLTFVVR